MNRLDFLILSILKANGAVNQLRAMTIREIVEAEEDCAYKDNTIFKRLQPLEHIGHVDRGLKESRASTYYITKAGVRYLDELVELSNRALKQTLESFK